MFGVYELSRLAQEKYHERVRKLEWREVEGVTVWVPTILGRIVLALRAARRGRAQNVRQPSTRLTPGSVMAK